MVGKLLPRGANKEQTMLQATRTPNSSFEASFHSGQPQLTASPAAIRELAAKLVQADRLQDAAQLIHEAQKFHPLSEDLLVMQAQRSSKPLARGRFGLGPFGGSARRACHGRNLASLGPCAALCWRCGTSLPSHFASLAAATAGRHAHIRTAGIGKSAGCLCMEKSRLIFQRAFIDENLIASM